MSSGSCSGESSCYSAFSGGQTVGANVFGVAANAGVGTVDSSSRKLQSSGASCVGFAGKYHMMYSV